MIRLLAVAFLLLFAADARAATVTYVPAPPQDPRDHAGGASSSIEVRAAPGEANVLEVAADPGGVVVRDSGAPLTAVAPCGVQADGSVHCPGGVPSVAAGDGDDRVVAHTFAIVDGGAGDDALTGDDAYLYGGDGDDVLLGDGTLSGGPGRDRLTGGPEDDTLEGGPDADAIDGGAGTDQLDFSTSRQGVVVDLADPGPDGGDSVTGVENVQGGPGDDRIAGDAGKNRLSGGKGDDVLIGRAGDDELSGDEGEDRLNGGAGDDVMLGEWFDGGAGDDWLATDDGRFTGGGSCGAGDDGVYGPPARFAVRPGCEHVFPSREYDLPDVDVDLPHLGRRALALTLRRDKESGACRTRVTVEAGGVEIGRASVGISRRRHRLAIPLRRVARDVQVKFRSTFKCGRSRYAGVSRTEFRLVA